MSEHRALLYTGYSSGRSAYVAGPMTGIPEFNFDAFDAVTALLRRTNGWGMIINPAERDRALYGTDHPGFAEGDVKVFSEASGFDYHQAMRYDLGTLTVVDAIVLLPGWEESSGARNEKFVADCCGLQVWYAYNNLGWYVTRTYHPTGDLEAETPRHQQTGEDV